MIGPAEERDMEHEAICERIADLDALIEGAPDPCSMLTDAKDERQSLIRRKEQLEHIFETENPRESA